MRGGATVRQVLLQRWGQGAEGLVMWVSAIVNAMTWIRLFVRAIASMLAFTNAIWVLWANCAKVAA